MNPYTHRAPTLYDTGGSSATRRAALTAAGVICANCEILVFSRASDAARAGVPFAAEINRVARELEDGVLCAACVAEEKP